MKPYLLSPLFSLALAGQTAPEAKPAAQQPKSPATAPATTPTKETKAAPPATAPAPAAATTAPEKDAKPAPATATPATPPAKDSKPAAPTVTVSPKATPPAAPEVQPIPEDQVLARLGKTVLREKDFHIWLKALAGPQAQNMLKSPATLTQPRQQYLDLQVFAAKARTQNLNKLPEFEQTMKAIEGQVLMRILMDEERTGSEGKRMKEKVDNPTDQEIQAYFEKNTKRYETPEKFTARHILVGLKGSPRMGDKGLTEEEAKAKLAKIQAELKAGKTFESLVPEYSDDPGSKTTGGLYKEVTFGRFAKEFEAAVRTQELNKVGEPVKTQFGYHLILVESRTPAQPAVLDQVRDRVKKDMAPERRDSMMKAFLEEYRKEVNFVAGPDAAANLPKNAPKETAKPGPKETAKQAPKAPKQAPKETAKATKEASKEGAKETPKAPSKKKSEE